MGRGVSISVQNKQKLFRRFGFLEVLDLKELKKLISELLHVHKTKKMTA